MENPEAYLYWVHENFCKFVQRLIKLLSGAFLPEYQCLDNKETPSCTKFLGAKKILPDSVY